MSDRERAAQILELNDLGDRKPSALMDHLLGLVGDRSSEFLVREVFLRSLPDKISIVVAASTSGLRDLALEADRHFSKSGMLIATAQPTVNKVYEPTPEVHASFRPQRAARNRQPAQTGLCHYHAAFGAAARNCCAPCRGCRLTTWHAFRETPCQRPLVNTAAGNPSKLFRVHDSQSG